MIVFSELLDSCLTIDRFAADEINSFEALLEAKRLVLFFDDDPVLRYWLR